MSNATGTPNATGTNATEEAGELLTAPWWTVERELFDDQKGTVTLLVLLILWAALTFVGTVMCLPAPYLIATASSHSAPRPPAMQPILRSLPALAD